MERRTCGLSGGSGPGSPRVGQDVAAKLGLDLQRSRNGYSEATERKYVQVVVGRRQTTCSNYFFRFNPVMRARLGAAEDGWLVLVTPGFDTYLLVPWSVAQVRMGPRWVTGSMFG